ncbi:probable microtubule-binding protein TANGLED [Diospyros lotus]|uniref:probable microtubule-binding protein TANGLED n=1 Tax=Diospyros lotus TaxID=55363 RepID=UPI00225B1E63|nr:probable microtubule-binding protein TANGLED [Diospyros lotus]XP_052193598.1 probable microtubule-binding protein TANGLED [Diospyros lotus]
MVARTPPKQRKMVAPLNPTLLRETANKVEKCMARLQELQYAVAGGNKVIAGVSLSPRSTRGYLKTSLRCKQESLRIKSARSPPGKFPTNTGEWQRMSLPAMLVGETVGEILQASQFARKIVEAVVSKAKRPSPSLEADPRTPVDLRRSQRPKPPEAKLQARRKQEKQITLQSMRSESNEPPPPLQRARSRRINFKAAASSPPLNDRFLANRVSPRNRPWGRKTVLFPNPLFHSSPTKNHHKFYKTKSPIIARSHPKTQTPHKFLIKTKPKSSPPSMATAKVQVRIRSPPRKSPSSTAAKLRRSFSPSRLASRLISPLKQRPGFSMPARRF